jgi:glycosyltransferase involved in cell wall biosynthesis
VPYVSVIIPTYNRAAYLPATIDSVLAQDYRDFELIVVDDGSTDETTQVVQRYESSVQYVHQANQREGVARNHGIRRASGALLAFLDSDDVWLPWKLQADVAAFQRHPDAALVYSRIEDISSTGQRLGARRLPGPSGDVFDRLVLENFIPLSTVSVRRGAFEAVGRFSGEPELSGSIDWEAWVRLSARHPFIHVPLVTTQVRVHPQSMLSNGAYMERAMLRAVDLMLANPEVRHRVGDRRARVLASLYLAIAVNHYSAGAMPRAREYLGRAVRAWSPIVLHPRFPLTLAKSCLGPSGVAALRRFKAELRAQARRAGMT